MGLGTFSAGPYTVTWKSQALGLYRGDTPALRFLNKSQRIDNTSSYGSSLIGYIYLGRDAWWNAVLMEIKAATLAALFPFAATPGDYGDIGPIGVDGYDLSGALVLTAASGSLAATNGPVTFTANKAVMAPDFDVNILMGPGLKEPPISMSLLPYVISGPKTVNATYT